MLNVINDRRICVHRDVGDSPHLHRAKIRLTLAMRTSGKTSYFIRVKTSRINVRRTDLGNRRPLGANRLPDFSETYHQQNINAITAGEFIYGARNATGGKVSK